MTGARLSKAMNLLSKLLDKPQLKANDRIALRDFHKKFKCINTWLKSMEYLQTFLPTEYIVKAVKHLPNHLTNSFYKSHSNIILERNSFVLPEQFEKWLDTKVKD